MLNKRRLIYADEARAAVLRENPAIAYCIDRVKTVDAVEVVRCKDCKYYDNSEGICWCELNSKFFPGGLDWHGFPEDGFCSYGERRCKDG